MFFNIYLHENEVIFSNSYSEGYLGGVKMIVRGIM